MMENFKRVILICYANLLLIFCQLYEDPDFNYVNMSLKTNTLLPYRDLLACKCDLKYNVCDNFCCCDQECPSGLTYDWGIQNLCYQDLATVQKQFPLCSSFPDIFSEMKTLDSRQENFLTCLSFENVPYMGFFYKEITTSSIDGLFQSFANSNQNLVGFTADQTNYVNTESKYKSADYIKANNSGYPLYNNIYSIPTVDIFGLCQDQNFLRFFIDMDPIVCNRIFNMDEDCNENGTVSAYKLLNFFSVLSTPQLNSSNAIVQILNATSIDLATGNETIKTISSDNDLKPIKTVINSNSSTCSCSNVLKKAEVYLMVESQTIKNVSVVLEFYNSIPESSCSQNLKYKQSFSLKYLTGSYETYYPRSGNPGYIFGKPLMMGYMSSNFVNGKAIFMPKTQEAGISLNVSLTDGSCSLINGNSKKVAFSSIYFGQDQELSCQMNLNLTTMQDLCNSGSLANYEIFNNFNSDQNIYVGRYGNANPLYIQDWIGISNSEAFTSKTVRYDPTKLTCYLPTTTFINVFYGRSGSTGNLQKYIVHSEKVFSSSTYWKFSKLNITENQIFSLFLKIQFFEISQSLITGSQTIVPDYFSTWLSNLLRPFSITTGSNVFAEHLKSKTLKLIFYCLFLFLLFIK